MILNQEFIFAALDAEKAGEKFPINLNDDLVWRALGYQKLDNCINRLESYVWFKYNVDYVCIPLTSQMDTYLLSVDAYKTLAAVAETFEGHETRRYFIQVENEYRANLERQFAQPDTTDLQAELETVREAYAASQQEVYNLSCAVVKLEQQLEPFVRFVV